MKILMPYWAKQVNDTNFYGHFSRRLEKTAAELGHSVTRFDFAVPGTILETERVRLQDVLLKDDFDLVLDLCGKASVHMSQRVWDGSDSGESLLDSVEVPYVCMLLDQVYNQALLEHAAMDRLHVAYPDRLHPEQIAMAYPAVKPASLVFSPPAVHPADDMSQAPWADRKIDVLYVGNLVANALERTWVDMDIAELMNSVADMALSMPEKPLHHCLRDIAASRSMPVLPSWALHILPQVETFLRARFRLDLVQAAARSGCNVVVVGDGWKSIALPGNVSIVDAVGYQDMLGLFGASRICLSASTYLNGGDDRIYSITVNGALCVTNRNDYAAECYGRDGRVMFYSLDKLEALPGLLNSALSEGRITAERALDARTETLKNHTWKTRLENIARSIS